MLLEPPDDVVGDSCPSQFDSEPAVVMASVRAELPSLPQTSAAFRASSASAWLQQRSHIQRDEVEPLRRAGGEWTSRNSQRCKARPSASAMVLARKRKRDEQRKLLNGKKQCTDSDGSECNAADSEQDSLDMEEQLTAFVEYNATDMDSLDINPSQDFDGDEEQDTATQASQHMQTCSWQDVTDVNQFQEEASEVFDNVIYAPRPASIPAVSRAPAHCRPQRKSEFGIARSSFLSANKAIPEKRVVSSPPSNDSEGSLSDGFDVATNLSGKRSRVEEARTDTSPKQAAKPQWRQRRSVKRDCSFLDNSNYSVNGRLLLMASPTPATASGAGEASSDRVIELKDGCFDSSEDVQDVWEEVHMRVNEVSTSAPSSVSATVDTMKVMPSTFSSGSSSLPTGFQPRLVRKRRKVGQLTLDGFFRK
ncbi:hypothetical protein PR003_g4336 [Phytophthora rubi]|uniref:Uncharacterized protein n=1 Tax=Phytophthora rubi TaxID=129364 RepID=A0A6A3NQQ5_9STRA|nr:hypothetical protein PR002_g2169 [Phytophthora rubi]KAE9048010.1 hypothetical protein PR001_g3983 [Phytophthora rubi]KAE9352560.1 hypothetical protein PR003_g4336 [Phytophthora rubi]